MDLIYKNVKFHLGNNDIYEVKVKENDFLFDRPIINIDGYKCVGWLVNGENFDFSKPITTDFELTPNLIKVNNKISYHLGEVYNSKEELFIEYFTLFYNYLNEYYPNSGVKEFSLNDFLNIAINWDYGNGKMTGLANMFHQYYVEFDEEGIVENQSEKGFVGYCYKNNKFRSFIKFLITFFAYWRTDEDYSSRDIHGNDFFYNSWASLVDTCKFFYLTYETLFSYQRTKRLLSCFVSIDSVVDLSNLPIEVCDYELPKLDRRGYKFVGWFTDENYKNEITKLNNEMTNVNLYAKWEKLEYTVYYRDFDGSLKKKEKYPYQSYVNIDKMHVYLDLVENSTTLRLLKYTKSMPIINDIIFEYE